MFSYAVYKGIYKYGLVFFCKDYFKQIIDIYNYIMDIIG